MTVKTTKTVVKKAAKKAHKHWWTAWRPLGNGQPLYNRECRDCGKYEGRDLWETGEESVQLKTGGFRLVKSNKKRMRGSEDDYKRVCGEIWDALGVAPENQEGILSTRSMRTWALSAGRRSTAPGFRASF